MSIADGSDDVLGYYEKGATTYFACQADQRFGYYLYVPKAFSFEHADRYRLCALIHGTGRTPSVYRDHFADFAEANDAIILAPLFPSGIIEPRELSNYKFLEFRGIRYDRVFLAMVEEVVARYRLTDSRFMTFGFSGGGHFVHRFAYLYPEKLLALSVGAPGMVTLLDSTRPWWTGTQDVEARFGRRVDIEALRRVPVQMVIGAEDTETWEITIEPGSRFWMEGANDAGLNRIDRIQSLKRSFEARGVAVQLDMIPGVGHEGYRVLEQVKAFFTEILRRARAEGARIAGTEIDG